MPNVLHHVSCFGDTNTRSLLSQLSVPLLVTASSYRPPSFSLGRSPSGKTIPCIIVASAVTHPLCLQQQQHIVSRLPLSCASPPSSLKPRSILHYTQQALVIHSATENNYPAVTLDQGS
ncbi:hypothetical protein CBL_10422 [Carabus blaptoides fortunei]